MPMWSPPTPPHDDNDVYLDDTLLFLYEPSVMPETQLPPVYVKKERKKVKVESITTRKQKQRKEEQLRVPRSLFDRPTAQLLKLRRDAKIQKLKMGQMKPYRPLPTLPQKPMMDQAPDHPEWLIHEDWALLQAVQNFFDVPLNLMIVNPAHTPNWDMVADVVNSCSRVYRSAKHCRLRYETVIIPREEGKIMYDLNPRKQKKQKGIYKMPKSSRAMKTGQIHSQDSNNGLTILYSLRFESVKGIANKRPPTMRQTLINPTLRNPKHASVLQENGISYDQPLNPMQVAEIRAERIQREKKQNQQQQQAAAASAASDQSTAVAGTPITGGIQRAIQNVATPQVSQPTIVALTSGVTATQLATIGTAVSSATVLTVTGTPLAQAAIRQRAPLTVQEIGSGATVVGQVANTVSQVRAQLQGTATSIAPTLQLAQRITAATSGVNTVPAQLQAQGSKPLTQQQQIQLFQHPTLQHQTLIKKHTMLQQQQQFKMQKVTIDPRQQQLQQVKRHVVPGQKTVIHQQLVTGMTQGAVKPGTQMARTLTSEEIARLNKQQQQKLASGQALVGTQIQQAGQGTQIIGTSMQPVSQTLSKVSAQQAGATLVKTVSAPPGNVSINVSMPQKGKVNQLSQMQLLQHRKQIPVQKGIATGQKVAPQMVSAVQIIQQQTRGGSLTVQQLQQIMKQQMIHTSQPTIIATVTQSQSATPQMVTKVLATTSNLQPTQIQSVPSATVISGQAVSSSTSSPVYTLSQVSVPSLSLTSLPSGQSSVTASIVKPGLGKGGDGPNTVQIHPISSIGQQSKLTGVPQSVIVQPVQSIQHVTVSAPVVSQQQVPVATQQVTVATPQTGQTLQMTMPASVASQHITIPHTSHVTVSAQRALSSTSSPMTVTLTPAAHQTISQSVAPSVTTVTIPGTSSQSHIVTTLSQTGSVSEQLAQQTVATILQRQPAIQVQRAPAGSTAGVVQQSGSQTIHIQSPVTSQTVVQSATTGQAQTDSQSPQTTPQGKSYGIRTRNQSKPQ